ncbi:MAG TPA: ATP-binding protein [Verrucomicrobiae bacterium]|nr:ATP-binding protein [Verrucomicrobiae bacterium]
MTFSRKNRLILLSAVTLAVLVFGVQAVYRLFTTRRSAIDELIWLEQMQAEFALIASNVPPALAELNTDCLAFAADKDRSALARFQGQSRQLAEWIEHRRAVAPRMKIVVSHPFEFTADVGHRYDEIHDFYQQYLSAAGGLTNTVARSVDLEQRLKAYQPVEQSTLQLLTAASEAGADAHAISLFMHGSQQWFPRLRSVAAAVVLLATLSGLCLLLILEVYRAVIRPLRKELVESVSTIEQQQQLALRGEHAAAVAHEIKNPLTAISVRLHTLQRALLEGSAEHEDALVIRDEINRLNRIVGDFLQLARPAEPELVTVSAATALQEVRDLFAPQFTRQAINLKLDAVTDARFRADPHQIKQVLINLVKNAGESIGRNGTVTLRARKATETLKGRPTGVVVLEVQDDGRGITPKMQERLFEPFFSTKEDGTGLGLPIAWRIVDKHGGVLDFRTTENQGSIFRIVLPCCEEG